MLSLTFCPKQVVVSMDENNDNLRQAFPGFKYETMHHLFVVPVSKKNRMWHVMTMLMSVSASISVSVSVSVSISVSVSVSTYHPDNLIPVRMKSPPRSKATQL